MEVARMKKTIKFSKLFAAMATLSLLLIISGVAGFFTKGINFGIDFQAGFIEKVRFAPSAFILTYSGEKNIQIAQTSQEIDVTVVSTDSENKVHAFPYTEYPTVDQFIEGVQKIDGITVKLLAKPDIALQSVFITSETSRITQESFRVHYIPEGIQTVDTDEVRHALASISSVSVQQVGEAQNRTFQIRLPDNGTYKNANTELPALINAELVKVYGADNFAVLSTDFVGSRFSGSLARQAILLVIGALFLIFIYALVRFRWTFALGAVLALVHDVLIMITFIVWSRMEFNSTTIAAILTIVGYSINDTVVVFDRIRENIRLNPKLLLVEVLDIAQTEVLSRTIITTVTTMLAAVSLYVFTSGSMKDFALALLVGMISGVYSTIYIAGACITFFSGKQQVGMAFNGKPKAPVSKLTV